MTGLIILIISIPCVIWVVVGIAICAVFLNDFWYETFNLQSFVEQIKACFLDESRFNIPISVMHFNRLTVCGKFVFSVLWLFFSPAYVLGISLAFIIWVIYWVFQKTCFKNNMEE